MGAMTKPISTASLTPTVDKGKLRFVLSWPNGPKDLDIHSIFKISRFAKCEVYFGKRDCVGVTLDTDNFNSGASGVETITINNLGKYYYTFAVHKYVDISGGQAQGDNPVPGSDAQAQIGNNTKPAVPDLPLALSGAKISVYAYGFKAPIYNLKVPNVATAATTLDGTAGDANSYGWWLGFCLNGNEGINSLSIVNKLSADKPDSKVCESLYTTPQTQTAFVQTTVKKLTKAQRSS